MPNITVRLSDEFLDELDAEAEDVGEDGVSRSEYIRTTLRRRHEHERVRSEYEDRIEELERENDRLQRERRQILDQRDEHTELVRHVEDERSERERRHERRKQNVVKRAWWFLAGEPDEPG